MTAVVDGEFAEKNQVVAALFELGGKDFGHCERVGTGHIGLEQDATIGAHRQSGPHCFLVRVGPKRNDHDLTTTSLFFELERFFDGILIERIQDELDATLLDRFAVATYFDAGLRIGHPLYTDSDFHLNLLVRLLFG